MNQLHNFFSVSASGPESAEALRSRWATPEFRALTTSIKNAILHSGDLPQDIPFVEVRFHNKPMRLADLRGIVLSDLKFGDVDLSYCCFDFADIHSSHFERTSLQYSTFVGANLDGVEWNAVQASPICASNASLSFAKLNASYLMGSNLENVEFHGAKLRNMALAGSWARGSSFFSAHLLEDVDVTGMALAHPGPEGRLPMQGLIGEPCWLDDLDNQRAGQHADEAAIIERQTLSIGEQVAKVISEDLQWFVVAVFDAPEWQEKTLYVRRKDSVSVGDMVVIAPQKSTATKTANARTIKWHGMRKKRKELLKVVSCRDDLPRSNEMRWGIRRVLQGPKPWSD